MGRSMATLDPRVFRAGRFDEWPGRELGAVMTLKANDSVLRHAAKAFTVDDEALPASGEVDPDLRDRGVRHRFEARPQASIDAVNTPNRFDVELTLEIQGDVR
jgi:hypothetical protein